MMEERKEERKNERMKGRKEERKEERKEGRKKERHEGRKKEKVKGWKKGKKGMKEERKNERKNERMDVANLKEQDFRKMISALKAVRFTFRLGLFASQLIPSAASASRVMASQLDLLAIVFVGNLRHR